VGESGIIITRMEKDGRSVMVAVYRTPCAIPPRKQKQKSVESSLRSHVLP
jgi:hypothetical protein